MADGDEIRTANMGIRTWPSLKAVIDQLAKEDNRTTAQYIEVLLINHARALKRWPKT